MGLMLRQEKMKGKNMAVNHDGTVVLSLLPMRLKWAYLHNKGRKSQTNSIY